MEQITIPLAEYQSMINQIQLLQENQLLEKMNKLIDSIYETKYGLYMGDYTNDITKHTINNMEEWQGENGDAWNDL